jgi:hypothetical protein
MNTLRCFLRESTNFRQGSDVPEGGELNAVARLTFPRLDFEIPTGVEQEEKGVRLQRLKRNSETLGLAAGYT